MSPAPYRILVVANETVGGRALIDAIVRHAEKARGEGKELSVVVVCPQNQPKKGLVVVANQTVGGEPLIGLLRSKAQEGPHNFIVICPQGGAPDAGDANQRLGHTLERLRQAGLEAVGQVMDPDPFTAIQNALQFYAVDEIVISTFPATRSGWMRADLVERVQASTSLPVEHVVVNPSDTKGSTAEKVAG